MMGERCVPIHSRLRVNVDARALESQATMRRHLLSARERVGVLRMSRDSWLRASICCV